jgi:hypothetical protein
MRLARAIGMSLACAAAGLLALDVGPALASGGGPQWTVSSVSRPTNFAPGDHSGEDAYIVSVTNTGGGSSDGSPVTITDELPQGLSFDPAVASGEDWLAAVKGESSTVKFKCVFGTCTYTGVVTPGDMLMLRFPIDVAAAEPASVANVVRVSGGGASDASVSTPTAISSTPASFGIAPGGASTALSSTQAGAHPDLTTSIAFNTVSAQGALAGDIKDTTDELPPGFAGDLVDTPACPASAFNKEECSIGEQIGVTTVTFDGGLSGAHTYPVYNLAPNHGEVAKLGFLIGGQFGIQGEVSLRPGDYGLTTTFHNINETLLELDSVSLTVWGVPADPIHDPWRWHHFADETAGSFGIRSDSSPVPFFTNPTACGSTPLEARFKVTSWQQPDPAFSPPPTGMSFGPLVGCDRLGMKPALTAEATSDEAYSPTGLDLTMNIPQTYDNAEGLATSTLKRAVVTLPEGMTVNPSAGAGLQACTEAQFAEEGAQLVPGSGCPSESKLGSVKIFTPSLKEEVSGSVFLAQPYSNRFGALLALYVVARDSDRGVIVKAAGEVEADESTGRLVTTFDELPPLPFKLFTFSFIQGPTSPLVTPPACGQYTVQAQLTTWSSPDGQPLTPLIPPFPISSGFAGGACSSGGIPPFHPQVLAGTQDNRAGSYSPLYIRVIRGDGEQEITRFSAQLPPGLTANLSGVPFCPDADIAAAREKTGAQEEARPSCPAASQVGHTLVGAGVGSTLVYAPGKVYMAGPYNGAPFSIAAITSAKVGPFDLGTVVVREALRIDPNTALVTVDASASDPIPHIIRGIVVHVRDIRVYVDRPDFTLNPTSCERLRFAATVDGAGSDAANPADQVPVTVDDPFQAAECGSLAFKPSFTVSTSGKTSRAFGASLTVRLVYPKTSQGTQANIRSVKVDLPKQLPSRLTTLQKACQDATFNENPAACPAVSRVGAATAVTPILPVPLTGPAYFVSHGGAKFPELIVVLQGYGVTIELHGETFINKAGITSSTFRTIPDQPVGSFELTLPEGPDSALAANGNLCKSRLAMPTVFTAQNGAAIHQSTPIAVTGCKPALRIVRRDVKGTALSIVVSVPSAGRLLATGNGLARFTTTLRKAGPATLTLQLDRRERLFLSRHPGRRLKVAVKLLFTPKHGFPLTARVSALMR